MGKQTIQELTKLKRQYRGELKRQQLEKEVVALKKKANPPLLNRVDGLIRNAVRGTFLEGALVEKPEPPRKPGRPPR